MDVRPERVPSTSETQHDATQPVFSMTKVILAYPYSGAAYRYFSDEIGESSSHSRIAESHSYYKTLYGQESVRNVELTLCFLLLHDEVWIAPADNHWPRSKVNPDDRGYVAELGLHADWDDFMNLDNVESREGIAALLADPRLQGTLGKSLRLPRHSWSLAVEYALYEASLSAKKRIPILCSPGRRQLITTLVEVQKPSLHPVFFSSAQTNFVETYCSLSGLALKPRSLDDLMDAKPDKNVRKYAKAFMSAAEVESMNSGTTRQSLAKAALEAIETERIASLFSGVLNWSATFLRLMQLPGLASAVSVGSYLANRGADQAGWYEFRGSIDNAITRAAFIRRLQQAAKDEASDA